MFVWLLIGQFRKENERQNHCYSHKIRSKGTLSSSSGLLTSLLEIVFGLHKGVVQDVVDMAVVGLEQ